MSFFDRKQLSYSLVEIKKKKQRENGIILNVLAPELVAKDPGHCADHEGAWHILDGLQIKEKTTKQISPVIFVKF